MVFGTRLVGYTETRRNVQVRGLGAGVPVQVLYSSRNTFGCFDVRTSRRQTKVAFFLSCALTMAARPLRHRARGSGRAAAGRCRWCIRAGSDTPDRCTWSSVGSELGKFTCGADVRAACPGHMAAAVWRSGRCRQQNADRLKRCLTASKAECSGSVPQHGWAQHALDAYEWECSHPHRKPRPASWVIGLSPSTAIGVVACRMASAAWVGV